MGMTYQPVNLSVVPPELRPFFDRLNKWALDKDRFERAVASETSSLSGGDSLALTREPLVASSRVGTAVTDTMNPLSFNGSLVPSAGNDGNFDIGENTTPLRWRDAWFTRNVDLNGNMDVGGTFNATGAASLASSLIVTGGATFSGGVATTGDAIFERLQVTQGTTLSTLRATSGVTLDSSLNVLGGVTGGLSISGGITVTGLAALESLTATLGTTLSSTLTVVGGVSFGGNVNLAAAGVSATGTTISPVTNLTGSLGANVRRWAKIYGGSLTLTNSLTLGGTITQTSGGVTSTLQGAYVFANDVTMEKRLIGPTLGVGMDWIPDEDKNDSLFVGTAGVRWGGASFGGVLQLKKGSDLSGTTLTISGWSGTAGQSGGNYFDVTGTSTVTGLSTRNGSQGRDMSAGTFVGFQLDSNPSFTHNATKLKLRDGITFQGQTGDHITFISDGSDNWREWFRHRATSQIRVAEGANKPMGQATLIAGVTNVNNTLVTANSRIFVTPQNTSGTAGFVSVSERTVGGSFTILSSNILDTRDVAWLICEAE